MIRPAAQQSTNKSTCSHVAIPATITVPPRPVIVNMLYDTIIANSNQATMMDSATLRNVTSAFEIDGKQILAPMSQPAGISGTPIMAGSAACAKSSCMTLSPGRNAHCAAANTLSRRVSICYSMFVTYYFILTTNYLL